MLRIEIPTFAETKRLATIAGRLAIVWLVCISITISMLPVSAKPEADNTPIRDKWAVVIGIDRFQDRSIPTLDYASKDASDFAQFLIERGHFAKDHVLLLLNEKATEKKIRHVLGDDWLPKHVLPGDLVVVFASTHGSPKELDVANENFLIAYDTDCDSLFSSAIKLSDLAETIKKRTGCQRLLLLLDACNSGAAEAGGKGLYRSANFELESMAGDGQIIISSSSASQRSWESKRYANGVFTKRLMEALLSKGESTTIFQAFDLLKDKVEQEVRYDRKTLQTPVLKSRWHGIDLALLVPPARPRSGIGEAPTTSDTNSTGSTSTSSTSMAQTSQPSLKPDGKSLYELAEQEFERDEFEKAVEHYKQAAQQGSGLAAYSLATMYDEGTGVNKDTGEAYDWYLRAADLGNARAQYNLGYMFKTGSDVVKQDPQKAIKWFTRAAEQGSARAQNYLGLMYQYGEGTSVNLQTAASWFLKAATQGHMFAQNNLGWLYLNGTGVNKDERAAVEWCGKAANQGYAQAQFNMGWFYETGRGVDKNLEIARSWYEKAAARSFPGAQEAAQRCR